MFKHKHFFPAIINMKKTMHKLILDNIMGNINFRKNKLHQYGL